jgi:hypothetical protein
MLLTRKDFPESLGGTLVAGSFLGRASEAFAQAKEASGSHLQ